MGLREAMMQIKQQRENEKVDSKIQAMLDEQRKLIDGGIIDTNKVVSNKTPKTPAKWNEEILSFGGVSTYKTKFNVNGAIKQKSIKVSVTNKDNDVVLKFHTRIASGERLSVNAKSYKDAQQVVDELMGKGMYKVSGSAV